MCASNFRSAMLAAMSITFFSGYHSENYRDIEALGVNCPERDRCEGYKNHLTYMDRSCECDPYCTAYKDCCIDALPIRAQAALRPPPLIDVKCLHYGEDDHTGVYAISKCSRNWRGSRKIRERCHGRDNFSDPLTSAPVTDVIQNKTYRNLACAECNNANLQSLMIFQLKLCEGLLDLTEEEIMRDLTYNPQLNLWGIHRLNVFGSGTEFVGCDIIFDVPWYLNNSVRFCRSNLLSRCAPNWVRPAVAKLCASYTTAIYTSTAGYRNPHCAICNYKTMGELSCRTEVFGRKRPMSFALLLDVNPTEGKKVGMRSVTTPECPTGHKYDPFFKKCRQLVCALPGYILVNRRCVRG